MNVTHITDNEQFKTEVMEFDGLVVADFWAERCGPCRMLGPIMEELVTDNSDKKVKIVKINVDENKELASSFQVSSIPVVFFIKNGKAVDTIVGANPKEVYQGKIDELTSASEEGEAKMAA